MSNNEVLDLRHSLFLVHLFDIHLNTSPPAPLLQERGVRSLLTACFYMG
jgi:hypothetical protein